jgi:hypothetical protein
MGLAERRAVEQFKNGDYPDWKAKIDDVAGFEVSIEVKWEELAVSDFAGDYAGFFAKVYFQPLVDALTGITVDELGRTALRDGLKTIIVRNSGGFYSTSGITFTDGVLTFDHQPHVNVDDVDERTKGLRQILESGL